MNWNKTIMKALARLRESDMMGGGAKGGSGLPVICLLSAILCILLCAMSGNAIFTVTVLAILLAWAALLPIRDLKQVMKALVLPVVFALIIMLPAVFLGSPRTMLTVTMKVAEAVLALALMGIRVPFQSMTEGLRQFHLPEIFILVLDHTIRFLVILGRYSNSLLEAVTMRSVGKVNWKNSGAGGILGTTFLKSAQMSQATADAMRLRGFDGTYPTMGRERFSWRDLAMLGADVILILFFVYTQMAK